MVAASSSLWLPGWSSVRFMLIFCWTKQNNKGQPSAQGSAQGSNLPWPECRGGGVGAGLTLKRNLGRVSESALVLLAEWRFLLPQTSCQDSCLYCSNLQKCWFCRYLGCKDGIIMMKGQEGDDYLPLLPHGAIDRRQPSANLRQPSPEICMQHPDLGFLPSELWQVFAAGKHGIASDFSSRQKGYPIQAIKLGCK